MHVQAQRLLLRSALQDPLNQRFVFLSEACAPLIPAATMYAQLMSEPRSRINACNKPDWDRNLDRRGASSATPLAVSAEPHPAQVLSLQEVAEEAAPGFVCAIWLQTPITCQVRGRRPS